MSRIVFSIICALLVCSSLTLAEQAQSANEKSKTVDENLMRWIENDV